VQNQDKPSIRIMTYNIHRWAGQDERIDVNRLAEVIQAVGADVVGLNEVLHPVTDGHKARHLLAELADRLCMHYVFGPSGWQDFGPSWEGPVGNALLSRYPLSSATNTWLPRMPTTKQRSLVGAVLADGPAAGLAAYVTHLDHLFEGTRLVQVSGVLRSIAGDRPHFVAGDFNAPGFVGRRSRRLLPPVLRQMRRAGYQDAFRAVGSGYGPTFPSHAPLWRLDFLFFPNFWASGLRAARTLDLVRIHHVSDHRPVVVEWSWPEQVPVQ
jgi:endonuclease/exonuclease/phosphatase family metal-dependent hydrolase